MAQFHDAPERYLELMRAELPLYDRLQDEVVAATAGPGVARILDLGIGTGEPSLRCLDAHPGAALVGVDASGQMLEIAAAALGPRADLRLGWMQDELPGGPFDLIVSARAVHHLDAAGKAGLFRRVAARLARGGRFVMGDVIVPDVPATRPAPLDPSVDLPDRLPDLVGWLAEAGLRPAVTWAEQDLAVIAAS